MFFKNDYVHGINNHRIQILLETIDCISDTYKNILMEIFDNY